ncbi:MAG: hypothetical protein K0R98_561 [Rickettsiaceae bacterium]|nr:hypothetical protein [Rickettsiaceae bacterium]
MSGAHVFNGNSFSQPYGENGGVVSNSRNQARSFAIGNSENRPHVAHGAVHAAQAVVPETTVRVGSTSGHGVGTGDAQYANPSYNEKLYQNKVQPTEVTPVARGGAISGAHGMGAGQTQAGQSDAGQLRNNGQSVARYN